LVTIVFEAVRALIEDLASLIVALLLEKSRSTDTLTPGMHNMSRAIAESTGN
jgi:hypothetical protein